MKRLIPYITFACLTSLTATNGSLVMAVGCNSNMNKTEEMKCVEDDTECQTEKTEKFGLKNSFKS